jgi:uncharacterized metal-binding protein
LKEILGYVAQELRAAHEQANSEGNAIMAFDECELDFAVDVEAKAEGGVHVWVVNLGAGAKRTEKNSIKIKYKAISPGLTAVVEPTQAPPGQPLRQNPKAK